MSVLRRFPIIITPVLAFVLLSLGANWPQWRGPGSQGRSPEAKFPTEWSPEKNVAWRTEIPGRGHSSPIVWDDRVFLTTAIEGAIVDGAKAVRHTLEGEEFVHPESVGADRSQTLKVLCLHRDTGKILWDQSVFEGIVYDARHKKGSFASPTSVTDGRRVYSYFGPEGVYCHDFDGKEVWRASVGKIATLGMGVGSSPVLFEKLLLLQCDEDGGESSAIIGIEAATGKLVWKTSRKAQVSWTTPVLLEAAGSAELFVAGVELMTAYEPKTGKELWHSKGLESNAIHTPLVGDGLVIASAGYPSKRVMALRRGARDEASDGTKIEWSYNKGPSYVASPVLYEGRVYIVSDRGVVTCLDAKSGEVKYEDGRVQAGSPFTASPVAFDGKVLLTSDEGDTFVIKASEKFELLRTNPIGEQVLASPALSQGRIFLRGVKHLWCLREMGA